MFLAQAFTSYTIKTKQPTPISTQTSQTTTVSTQTSQTTTVSTQTRRQALTFTTQISPTTTSFFLKGFYSTLSTTKALDTTKQHHTKQVGK